MCKKYPGKRCGNPVHERVESLISQVKEAKAFRDVLDPDQVKRSDISDANRRVTILEARLKDAQAKYDATDAGFSALESSSEDTNLSIAERSELKVRLKDAAKERADREKVVSDSGARRANVMAYLEQAGVPASERIEFNDTNIYMAASGSAKHYETIKDNRMTAYQTRLAEYNKALAKVKTPAEKAKVEDNEGLALAKAKSDYNRALYVYDSTAQGIDGLKQRLARATVCFTNKDVVNRTKLELRLSRAEKAHRFNLDSRNYRTAKLAQLKAIVDAHGGDVTGAMEAFKNKNPLPKTAKRRVPVEHMRSSKVYAHLTERDTAIIESEFKKSPEYKAGSDGARARFLERKILMPPHEIYLRESVTEADARVVIGSNGRTGRNNTVIDATAGQGLARNQMLGLGLTEKSAAIIADRAKFSHTSKSSYLRSLLLGENPMARENDRSALYRAMRYAVVSERVMNGLVPA